MKISVSRWMEKGSQEGETKRERRRGREERERGKKDVGRMWEGKGERELGEK